MRVVAKNSKRKREPVRRPIPAARLTAPKRDKTKYHFGQLRGSAQTVQGLLLAEDIPADLRVEMLPTLLWLHHMHGQPGNMCVNGVMILHHAYQQLGIVAQPRAVDLVVHDEHSGRRTLYGRPDPMWTDTAFLGHAVLWLPRTRRLVDATVEQYPEVRRYRLGPVFGRAGGVSASTPQQQAAFDRGELPPGSHIGVRRKSLNLLYTTVGREYDTVITDAAAVREADQQYRDAGINLASQALTFWRLPEIAERIREAPYPRLHALLDAIGDAAPVVDEQTGQIRFAFPAERGEDPELVLRLDELALPADLPAPESLPALHQVATLPSPQAVSASADPARLAEQLDDVRTEARLLLHGDRYTGGGDEPVVVFEPLRAVAMRRGQITTEAQAEGIVAAGFAWFRAGRGTPPHLPGWSVRRTGDGLELWDASGLWARAALDVAPDWAAAARQHGQVRVVYGVRTGARVPHDLSPADYTDQRRGEELLDSRRQGIVAFATMPWQD
jgi:hypothetical protein